MTQVERLIRNLCEARRLAIRQDERTALKGFKESETWQELPAKVKRLVARYHRYSTQAEVARRAIQTAGYTTNYNLRPGGKEFYRSNRDAARTALKARFDRRCEAIQTLRTDSTVEALGMTAVQGKSVLATLQAALAKV